MATKDKPEKEDQTEPAPLNLWQRISKVRDQVTTVAKEKEVGFGDNAYKVATHEGVNAMLRPLLVDHGLVDYVTLVVKEIIDTGKKVGKKNMPMLQYRGTYAYHVVAIDDGQEVSIVVDGHGDDTGDKGPGKATTYALKTGRAKMFSIPTGEDEEGRIAEEDFRRPEDVPLTPEQLDHLLKTADDLFGKEAQDKLYSLATKLFGVEAVKDIPSVHANNAFSALNKQRDREVEQSSSDDDVV